MATDPTVPQQPIMTGVPDTRAVPLHQLAGQRADTAAEALRHVLPADETGRVAVAAFASSI